MKRLLVAFLFFPLCVLASVTSTTTKSGPFLFTGSPQTIPIGFPAQQASDLLVLDTGPTASPHDPALVLTLGSDYTVTGLGYNGSNQMQTGSIVVVSTGANSVAVNDYIVILRNAPFNQTSVFSPSGPLTINLIEQALDKMATLSQQVNELGSRSLHFENFEFLNGNLSKTARTGNFLGFDSNGNLAYYPTGTVPGGFVSQIVAGTNVTISPSGGTGAVTINSTATVAPGGSNTQLQYNNSGVFGGTSGLTWTGTGLALAASGAISVFDLSNANVGGDSLIRFTNDQGARLYSAVLGSTFAGTTAGISNNNLALITTSQTGGTYPSALMFGTGNGAPVYLMANNTNYIKLDGAGNTSLPLLTTNGVVTTNSGIGNLASTTSLSGIAVSGAAGSFTTLSASSTVSGTGFSTYLASPPAIGGTAPNTVAATTLSASSTLGVTGQSTLTGNVGIGGSPSAFNALNITSALSNNNVNGGSLVVSAYGSFTASQNGNYLIGYYVNPSIATGTGLTGLSYYGADFATPTVTGSSGLNTAYQLYIGAAPAATTKYGIYQAGTDQNVFGGLITAASIQNTPIGSVTPSTVAATTLSASSTVSGTGFSTYLASPPAIGGTAPNTVAATTLSASSTVSGTGFSTYLASPPAIGGTAPSTGAFTTLSASGTASVGAASAGISTFEAHGNNTALFQAKVPKTDTTGRPIMILSSSDTVGSTNTEMRFTMQGGTSGTTYWTQQVTEYGYGYRPLVFQPLGSVVYVSATAAPSATQVGVQLGTLSAFSAGSATGSTTLINFINGNGTVGSIAASGLATAYNTSSDARLKTNFRDFTDSDAGAIIDGLRPRWFDWKSGARDSVGFIAQEENAVSPVLARIGAVTVGDDDPTAIKRQWQRSDSALVPIIVAEVKALRVRVAALESERASGSATRSIEIIALAFLVAISLGLNLAKRNSK